MNRVQLQRGYVALILTLVLSFALTLTAITAGESALFSRLTTTDLENQMVARQRAQDCGAIALLLLAQDPSYRSAEQGDPVFLAAGEECWIQTTESPGDDLQLRTFGREGESTSLLGAYVKFDTISIPQVLRWEEI